MVLRRMAVSSPSPRDETSSPMICRLPSVGVSRQPMTLSSVDLPEPEGPMMETN